MMRRLLQIGAHRGVERLQARRLPLRRGACRADRSRSERALRGGRLSRSRRTSCAGGCVGARERLARHGQLHRADGDHGVAVAHLDDASHAFRRASQPPPRRRRPPARRARGSARVARRCTLASSRSSRSSCAFCSARSCSARWRASRPASSIALGAARLEILDRALDLGARVEQVAPRVLPRLALGDRSRSRTVRSRFATVGDASPARRRAIAAASRSRVCERGPRAARAARSARRHRARAAAAALRRARRRSRASCSRRAIEMPYERPGMPLISRYVGASATASNCSDAFTTPRHCDRPAP